MRKLLSIMLCLGFAVASLSLFFACDSNSEQKISADITPPPSENNQAPVSPPDISEELPKDDTGESQRIKIEPQRVRASFSTKNLQMIGDYEGISFVFNINPDDGLVEINVKQPGNRFRIYATKAEFPLDNFELPGFAVDGDIIHDTDDARTSYTFRNRGYSTVMVYISNNLALEPEVEVFMNYDTTNIQGNVPFSPWACPDQPDALGGENSFADCNWNADEIIENMYEPLREAYPEYITRECLGKDSSGQYDMWKYVFTPESYTQTIYIQSGVHNREKAALLGLARFLEILCKGEDKSEDMLNLRNNVRLVVVPIVNPWGISLENPQNDANFNGINLNRDVENEQKQAETVNVLKVLEQYRDELSCCIDYHSTVNANYGDYSVRWSSYEQPNIKISDDIVNYLAEKNVSGEPDLHYHGKSDSVGTYVWYYWNRLGVPGTTVEHGDYRWDSESKYTSVVMTRSVELIGTVILNYANQEFKTSK